MYAWIIFDFQGPASWRMLYGMDVNTEKGVLLVADNFGYLYLWVPIAKSFYILLFFFYNGLSLVGYMMGNFIT